ncbi:MAG: M23 family metallopeptidase [Anaeromyxobacteraceae bacterium]|nr:M23 family metallopeptidase [Anaeromyxobacteraceae bacterium]
MISRAASAPAGAASTAGAAVDPRLAEASRALEAMLVKQIVTSSRAFGGGESAGAGVRADLFADTLANAVAASGGLGIAEQLARSLTPGGQATQVGAPSPLPSALAHAPSGGSRAALVNAAESLALPVAGRVTSGFGHRLDPLTGEASLHTGLDVGAPEGTPIRVPAGGVVLSAGPRGGYGNAVEVDHGNGLVTLYGHAAEVLVSKGEFVEPGQEIATVGSSGRSTGPHLHFEVRQGGRAVDPSRVLKKYGLRAEGSHGSGP